MSNLHPPDLNRRFAGIRQLYGEAALQTFSQSHVAVVGVGGIGSWAVEALARSAIGQLTLIDMDHVSESNINRQLHSLENTLGKAKVQVLKERIQQINPQCQVNCIEEMVETDNLAQLIHNRFDFIIDCIDGFRSKAALIAHCREQEIPMITTGGAGGLSDPSRIKLSDLKRSLYDPLLSKTRKRLRRHHGFSTNPKRNFHVMAVWSDESRTSIKSTEDPAQAGHSNTGLHCGGLGSCTPVTATFGLYAAGYVLREIASIHPSNPHH